jgi:hypothetical protein
MRARSRLTRPRPRVLFPRSNSNNSNTVTSNIRPNTRMASAATAPQPDAELSIPPLFTTEPLIRDSLPTESSRVQDATIDEVLPFLQGEEFDYCNSHGLPHLDRRLHVKFLHKQLGKLPAAFTAADPSRPWFFYWCLSALVLLGEDVTEYRQRLVDTVRPMQNQDGGFAGGFGHTSHLATSYATVLSLALVGGEDAYEVIDRRAMWRWLCSLKQPDGGFQMALGGEEDVRYVHAVPLHHNTLLCNAGDQGPQFPIGLMPWTPRTHLRSLPSNKVAGGPTARPSSYRYSIYLLSYHRTLLHDLLATLVYSLGLQTMYTDVSDARNPKAMLPSLIVHRKGQTHEGGVSAKPGIEAHGAYAFCALGCLSILDSPHRSIPRYASPFV